MTWNPDDFQIGDRITFFDNGGYAMTATIIKESKLSFELKPDNVFLSKDSINQQVIFVIKINDIEQL